MVYINRLDRQIVKSLVIVDESNKYLIDAITCNQYDVRNNLTGFYE